MAAQGIQPTITLERRPELQQLLEINGPLAAYDLDYDPAAARQTLIDAGHDGAGRLTASVSDVSIFHYDTYTPGNDFLDIDLQTGIKRSVKRLAQTGGISIQEVNQRLHRNAVYCINRAVYGKTDPERHMAEYVYSRRIINHALVFNYGGGILLGVSAASVDALLLNEAPFGYGPGISMLTIGVVGAYRMRRAQQRLFDSPANLFARAAAERASDYPPILSIIPKDQATYDYT
ncbi:MAG: hypothetical protein JWM81_125 [Candidatus Saccharibacteria bacterium]|nr:hypothetical protein [Candidatus Saccharibacteria bacterium]